MQEEKLKNKNWIAVFLLCWVATCILTFFIGTQIPIEQLRLTMEEKNLVFCEKPSSFSYFQEAIPTNISWEDLGYAE